LLAPIIPSGGSIFLSRLKPLLQGAAEGASRLGEGAIKVWEGRQSRLPPIVSLRAQHRVARDID